MIGEDPYVYSVIMGSLACEGLMLRKVLGS